MIKGSMRPDRLGIVVWVGKTNFGDSWYIDEISPGALDKPEVKMLLRTLEVKLPLAVIRADGLRSIVVRGSHVTALDLLAPRK